MLLDAAYPAHTAIKLILDNHFAHISKETKAWLADQTAGRFEFTFTPKHGSWLNLVEGFFSKLARSVLRHIRVASKQELNRIASRTASPSTGSRLRRRLGEPRLRRRTTNRRQSVQDFAQHPEAHGAYPVCLPVCTSEPAESSH